ncbi:hypothetical protein [Methylocystis sp. MJC1]|nr:hypothetical protein [Methylocystis sp. MJC1]
MADDSIKATAVTDDNFPSNDWNDGKRCCGPTFQPMLKAASLIS